MSCIEDIRGPLVSDSVFGVRSPSRRVGQLSHHDSVNAIATESNANQYDATNGSRRLYAGNSGWTKQSQP